MTQTYEKQYYTEVYKIISAYGNEYIKKIPESLLENIKSNIDEEYDFEYDPEKTFKEQNIKKEAVALIVAIKLQYWCKTEEERNELKKILSQNAIKHEEEKIEKYSYENMFKNTKEVTIPTEEIVEECTDLQIYKENVIIKIARKIKEFFKNILKRS